MTTVNVTADIRHPITEVGAAGAVMFQLATPFGDGSIVYGDNGFVTETVIDGSFHAPVPLEAEAWWVVTVQTDAWRGQFTVQVPASPSSTTLRALLALSAPAPTNPAQYIPLSDRGVPGGVATLDPITGLVESGQLPPAALTMLPWEVAKEFSGFKGDISTLTPHPDNDPDNAITLASGTTWDGYHFDCSELIITDNTVKVKNFFIGTHNADFGIRLDANTGQEHDRVFEQGTIVALGRAFAGGSGLKAILVEITAHGDDGFQFGRTHLQGPDLQYCYIHDGHPAVGAHADGLQQLAQPAADVNLFGCLFDLRPDPNWTVDPTTGTTGALFADVNDTPIPDDDPEPDRIGRIHADWCYFRSPDNYAVVVDDDAVVRLTNCTLVKGTTDFESVASGAITSGYGNVDENGKPLMDTAFSGEPGLHLGDIRDVDTTHATDRQILSFNLASKLWTPIDPPSGGGGDAVPLDTVTAKGDLIVGTGAAAVSRLAVGVSGKILGVTAGTPAWVDPPSGGGGGGAKTTGTGPQLGTFGPGNSAGAPDTLFPSSRIPPPIQATAGDIIVMIIAILSNGGQATGDVVSLVDGERVNYYSGGYTPNQAPNGHGGMYINGDFGEAQYAPVKWIVQNTDIAGDGTVTLAPMYQAGGTHTWGHSSIPDQVDLINHGH